MKISSRYEITLPTAQYANEKPQIVLEQEMPDNATEEEIYNALIRLDDICHKATQRRKELVNKRIQDEVNNRKRETEIERLYEMNWTDMSDDQKIKYILNKWGCGDTLKNNGVKDKVMLREWFAKHNWKKTKIEESLAAMMDKELPKVIDNGDSVLS